MSVFNAVAEGQKKWPTTFEHELTEQQQTIIDRMTGDSFGFQAVAGSSKTSLMKVGVPHLVNHNPKERIIINSFSNAITDDIKRSIDTLGIPNVKVSTGHSDAKNSLSSLNFKHTVQKHKGTENAEYIFRKQSKIKYQQMFSSVVQAAKACSLFKLTTKNPYQHTDISSVILEYGLIPNKVNFDDFVTYANRVYKHQKEMAYKGYIDFDDMLVMATELRNKKGTSKYSTVIIDESQDCNIAQLQYFQSMKADRYILSFDPYQRIYGFQGAVSDIIHQSYVHYNIEEILDLTYSFRVPHSIANYVRATYVPHFYAHKDNREGWYSTEEDTAFVNLIKKKTNDCFVLARSNAKLLEYFLKCLQNRIPAILEKSNISKVIKGIYLDCAKSGYSIERRLEERIDDINRCPYTDFKKQAFIRAEKDNHTAATVLFNYLNCESFTLAAARIEAFFIDAERSQSKISFVTMHRSKGRQTSEGILLPYQLKSDDLEETVYLPYVAWTRFTDNIINLIEER